MSLLVGALDNAQYSEEISIEFKCQKSLNEPIEKKPGLASRPARGSKGAKSYAQEKIIKQNTELEVNMAYFSTIIFDNSPGRR